MTSAIWSDADSVWIGELPPGPAGLSRLSVPGGVLIVDPLDPSRPALCLSDPDLAGETVVALFGISAWESIEAALGRGVPATGKAGSGWTLADACRLAVVRWLGEQSPDPLDETLLEIEAAVLADRLSPLVDLVPSARAVARALDLVEASVEGRPVGPRGAVDLARQLASIVADQGPDWDSAPDDTGVVLDDEELQRAADLSRHWADQYALPDADDPAWLAGCALGLSRQLTPVPAGLTMDAGEVAEAPRWRTCSTDWDFVPRGAFDPGEDAIRWRIAGEPPVAAFDVQVRAGTITGGRFVARLLSDDRPSAVCQAALSLSGDHWVGSATLLDASLDPESCWVDITSQMHPRPPRRGKARTAAAGRRWTSRAIARLRFGLGEAATLDSAAPLGEAIGCLERARIEYAALIGASGSVSDRRRHLALGIVLRDALLLRGEAYEADDLESELLLEVGQDPGEQLVGRSGGPGPGDYRHPAWRLTMAETALLIPSGQTG